MRSKGGFAGHLKKITEQAEKNIWFDNWIKHNILKYLEQAAHKGKNSQILKFSPYKLEEMGKTGGNIEQLKTIMYKENIDMVQMHGMGGFDDLNEDPDDIYLRFQW